MANPTTLQQALAQIEELEAKLQREREMRFRWQSQVAHILRSRGWRLLLRYYRLRDAWFPVNTRRRAAAGWLALQGKRLVRTFFPPKGPPIRSINQGYAQWIDQNEPKRADLDRQRQVRFLHQPTISILTPTFDTPPAFLEAMLQSVLSQTYGHWELCIADGASRSSDVRRLLHEYATRDGRLRVQVLPENRGIAGNTQAALTQATGEFIALLDHDDTLAPFALHEVVRAINDHADADVLYSDEDCITADGRRRRDPHFKPDWSPDTLRSHNYICHLSVLRRSLVDEVGGFRRGYDGSQDYDLLLRATERARRIVHIPQILYHWRVHRESVTSGDAVKVYAVESARRALVDHLARQGVAGEVREGSLAGTFQVLYPLTGRPCVSVIIPNKDQAALLERCIRSVLQTTYRNLEILIVENHSQEPATFALYERLQRDQGVRLLQWQAPFNYSSVNNFAVRQSRGELLLFLNNDVEAINDDWLERMVEHAVRPEVGAVGAKLRFADRTIQHGGIIVKLGGAAGHAHKCYPADSTGYFHRLVVTQNLSAVTAACLLTRRQVFDEVQGFDEEYPLSFNDVDFCLKIRQRGYRIIWTPHAELLHFESKTRGYADNVEKFNRLCGEAKMFEVKWDRFLKQGDPYYSPNLTLEREDFSLPGL